MGFCCSEFIWDSCWSELLVIDLWWLNGKLGPVFGIFHHFYRKLFIYLCWCSYIQRLFPWILVQVGVRWWQAVIDAVWWSWNLGVFLGFGVLVMFRCTCTLRKTRAMRKKKTIWVFFLSFIKQHVQHDCFRLTEKKTVTV